MTLKSILFLVFILICTESSAQILVMPTEYIITTPSRGMFEELSTVPIAAVNRDDFELEDYYNEILQELMQTWFEDNYEDVSFYSLEDSLINFRAFQGGVKREQPIYEMLESKPLFGYSGYKPEPGKNLKPYTEKLNEEYGAEYIVYTTITSLFKPSFRDKNDKPDYRGHLTGYCWIIDAKTGQILQQAKKRGPRRSKKKAFNQGYEYVPRYQAVNEKLVRGFSKGLQSKLKRKLAKEGFR